MPDDLPERAATELSTRFPARPESVSRARHLLGDYLRASGVPNGLVIDVQLAASEAVSNAVRHAYRDRDEPGVIEVTAQLNGNGVRVSVRDDGCGRPDHASGGAGLGLPLIRSVADEASVEQRPGAGTAVTMRFHTRSSPI